MSEIIALLRLAPEIRSLLLAVARLLEAGQSDDAADAVRSYRQGTAAGRAAYNASKSAGKSR